jgi:pyridoxamine 5'-phosphate oxidase
MSDAALLELPAASPATSPAPDFTDADEPFQLFGAWLKEAARSEPVDPNAMTLATVDADGLPNLRMVLLKSADETGFVFFTNLRSQKGRELEGRPKCGLLFHWKSLSRQVRIRGPVEHVEDCDADAYFASRPRQSQIGAWSSNQSEPLESRFAFERAIAINTAKFALGTVPRPPHWSGLRVIPLVMEFWHDRPFRLHDRIEFRRSAAGGPWSKRRLYP